MHTCPPALYHLARVPVLPPLQWFLALSHSDRLFFNAVVRGREGLERVSTRVPPLGQHTGLGLRIPKRTMCSSTYRVRAKVRVRVRVRVSMGWG